MTYKKAALFTPEWLKLAEVADKLNCDPKTARAMIRDGRLKVRAVQFDSITRINRKDFERELERRAAIGLSA